MSTKTTLLIGAILATALLAACADENNFTPSTDCPRHETPTNDDGNVTPHWNCGESPYAPETSPRSVARPDPETPPYDPNDPMRPGYWDGVPIEELPQ